MADRRESSGDEPPGAQGPPAPVRSAVLATAHAGLLVAVTGAAAWLSGLPFIFPSLGPSAFILAVRPGSDEHTAYRVIGGHFVAIVAGMAAYHVLAEGVVLSGVAPVSAAGLRLALSGTLSVALTSALMLVTGARHAPACATTLIVSLGILVSPADAGIILASVVALYAAHALVARAERWLLARRPGAG